MRASLYDLFRWINSDKVSMQDENKNLADFLNWLQSLAEKYIDPLTTPTVVADDETIKQLKLVQFNLEKFREGTRQWKIM